MSAVLGNESFDDGTGTSKVETELLGIEVKLILVLKSELREGEVEVGSPAVPLEADCKTGLLAKAFNNVAPAGIDGKAVATAPTPLSPPCC